MSNQQNTNLWLGELDSWMDEKYILKSLERYSTLLSWFTVEKWTFRTLNSSEIKPQEIY